MSACQKVLKGRLNKCPMFTSKKVVGTQIQRYVFSPMAGVQARSVMIMAHRTVSRLALKSYSCGTRVFVA